MKCKKHPKYQGLLKPRKSKNYQYGCPQCWKVHHHTVNAMMKPWQLIDAGEHNGKPYEIYSCNYGKTYTLKKK